MSRTFIRATALLLAALSFAACSEDGTLSAPRQPFSLAASWCSGLQPEWVAVQDGDSVWKRLQPTTLAGHTTFKHDFHEDKGGIATLSRSGPLTILSVFYGTPAELASVGVNKPLFCGSAVSKVLLGGIVGVDTNEVVMMAGDLSQDGSPWGGGSFALPNISEGPHDVIAVRSTRINGQSAVTGFILRRDVDLPDSTYMPVVDFASNETITPDSPSVTVNGISTQGATTFVRLITPTSEVGISPQKPASQVAVRILKMLPVSALRPADLQEVQAQAAGTDGPRIIRQFMRAGTNRSLTLPPALTKPTVTSAANTPLLRLKARFAAQSDFDRTATMLYQQGPNTQVIVTMAAGYAGLAGAFDLTVPDLSAAAGFDPAWGLHAGTPVFWEAARFGGTLGLGVDAIPVDGMVQRSAFAIGQVP